MTTELIEKLQETNRSRATDIHVVCLAECRGPDVAICGAPLNFEAGDDAEITCAVCYDLADRPCPNCGDDPYA